jgi:VWFA-related protein
VWLVLSLVLASNVAAAEQAPPTFSSAVELITVDVVVADRNGRPVAGLKRDDFVLKEDGAVQEIVGFEAFDSEPAQPAEPRLPAAASNEIPEGAPGAAFLLVLDDNAMLPNDAVSARRAVTAFLSRTAAAGDEVTLATTSGDLWWTARMPEGREDLTAVVARLQGRRFLPSGDEWMSDYEAHWIAEHDDDLGAEGPAHGARPGLGSLFEVVPAQGPAIGLLTGRGSPLQVRAQAIELDAERRVRTWALLKVMRRGLSALVGFQGRKSLLLLSPGFLDDSAGPVRELAAAAREANTVVYFVDVRGLVTLRGMASLADAEMSSFASVGTVMKSSTSDSAGAQRLAQDTGGFSLRNTNALGAGIDRIAAESRVYYLLAFHAPAGKPVNKWRKLRVEAKRPGLEVRARRGYRLSKAATDARPRIDSASGAKTLPASVERALDSARDAAAIPLRAKAYAFEPRAHGAVRVLVVGEFDAGGLTYEGRGAARAAHLEVTVAATDRDTGKTFNAGQSAELRAHEGSSPGWRSFSRELELPAGVAQVRTVVRDVAAGTLGAVSERIEVPPAGALRVSTPILTDRVDRGPGGQDAPRAALGAHRVFQPDRTLYCEFEVFGAARDLVDGAPRISDEIAVLAGGEVVREARFVRIVTEREGRAVRLVTLDLHDVPDGAYELSLSVHDDIAGGRVELREPFTLAR